MTPNQDLDKKIYELLEGSDALIGNTYVEDLRSLILSEAHHIGIEAIGSDFNVYSDDAVNTKLRLQWINAEKGRERQRLSELTGGSNE